MTTTKNTYLYGLITFIVMIVINFALWRLFFAPSHGVFKLFTPMYGLSLAACYFYSIILVADIFGCKNETGSIGKGVGAFISSVVVFYVLYYVFFLEYSGAIWRNLFQSPGSDFYWGDRAGNLECP